MKRPKPSLLRNALAGVWIIGGVALAFAVTPYLWRDSLPSPFWWCGVVAGSALAVAIIATGAVSRMSLLGLLFIVLGFVTFLILIGLVIAPVGIVLYAVGIARAGLVGRRTHRLFVLLLGVGAVTVFVAPAPIPGLVFALDALVLGVGIAATVRP